MVVLLKLPTSLRVQHTPFETLWFLALKLCTIQRSTSPKPGGPKPDNPKPYKLEALGPTPNNLQTTFKQERLHTKHIRHRSNPTPNRLIPPSSKQKCSHSQATSERRYRLELSKVRRSSGWCRILHTEPGRLSIRIPRSCSSFPPFVRLMFNGYTQFCL